GPQSWISSLSKTRRSTEEKCLRSRISTVATDKLSLYKAFASRKWSVVLWIAAAKRANMNRQDRMCSDYRSTQISDSQVLTANGCLSPLPRNNLTLATQSSPDTKHDTPPLSQQSQTATHR